MNRIPQRGTAAPPGADLTSVIRDKRILVTVGAGGVGKTTTAAALGLVGARSGRDSLVITIDPARRLAVSLGLEDLGAERRAVPPDKMRAAGATEGRMSAMMLEPKRTFDELIKRHTSDPQVLDRVMRNKIYHELSTRLAGGQEYAAMEELYHLATSSEHELIILDTPPTANAFDFLEAPSKMVDVLDGPAARLFVKTYEQAGRFNFKLLSFGASYVFKRIARFIGGEFLDDIAQFFGDLHSMLDGVRTRAAQVMELLAGEQTGFVLVTGPDPRAIDEAIGFFERLVDGGMHPSAFIVNRVHPLQEVSLSVDELREQLVRRCGQAPAVVSRLAPLILDAHQQVQSLAGVDATEIARLREACGEQYPYVSIPLLDDDVYDIGGLVELGRYLEGE